jgi:hypothetical protein
MKKLIALVLILAAFPALAAAQSYASRIRPMPALPAACNPLNGDVVMLTLGAGVSPGVYNCTMLNTWRPIGVINNGYALNQGTLTALTPAYYFSATWNNAAVAFNGFEADVTNTASLPGSNLLVLRVGGALRFAVAVNEVATFSAGTLLSWNGRSLIGSNGDSRFTLFNSALADFDRLSLGPEAADNPAIKASAAVAGQSQGIKIVQADGNDNVFADLGAAENGSITYCADCTIASPCAGAGTGAIAKRLNGVWVCN